MLVHADRPAPESAPAPPVFDPLPPAPGCAPLPEADADAVDGAGEESGNFPQPSAIRLRARLAAILGNATKGASIIGTNLPDVTRNVRANRFGQGPGGEPIATRVKMSRVAICPERALESAMEGKPQTGLWRRHATRRSA